MNDQPNLEGLSDEGLDRIYRVLCHMAHCDEEVDPREREVLEKYRKAFGLGESDAQEIENESQSPNGIFVGRDERERAFMLDRMIELVAADAYLDIEEYRRLQKTAAYIGIDEEALNEKIGDRFSGGSPPS